MISGVLAFVRQWHRMNVYKTIENNEIAPKEIVNSQTVPFFLLNYMLFAKLVFFFFVVTEEYEE